MSRFVAISLSLSKSQIWLLCKYCQRRFWKIFLLVFEYRSVHSWLADLQLVKKLSQHQLKPQALQTEDKTLNFTAHPHDHCLRGDLWHDYMVSEIPVKVKSVGPKITVKNIIMWYILCLFSTYSVINKLCQDWVCVPRLLLLNGLVVSRNTTVNTPHCGGA